MCLSLLKEDVMHANAGGPSFKIYNIHFACGCCYNFCQTFDILSAAKIDIMFYL